MPMAFVSWSICTRKTSGLHSGVKMRPNGVRRLRIWCIEKAGIKVLIQHERSCG